MTTAFALEFGNLLFPYCHVVALFAFYYEFVLDLGLVGQLQCVVRVFYDKFYLRVLH